MRFAIRLLVLLLALPALAQGQHSVTLNWTQATVPTGATCTSGSPGVTGNNIYRSTTSGGEGSTPLAKLATPSTTYIDTAVTAGTTYFYQVTAVNCNGESATVQ